MPPLYVMFRDRREDPGVSWGFGFPVIGMWLDAASKDEGAPIPLQIASLLRGKEFRNFREFRESFWKAVANDPVLSGQFNQQNINLMKKGMAAIVSEAEYAGQRNKFELHHKKYISQGGEVYNLNNIYVMTPKRHIATHQERNQ